MTPSVRKILLIALSLAVATIYYMLQISKDKTDFNKTSGVIEYLDIEYNDLPNRDKGKYRYLIIDSYPYLFEIYEPNSEPTLKTIDDLKIGDIIDVYFYENNSTHSRGVNKFVGFIDHNGEPYFIKNNFDMKLGFSVLALIALICLLAFFFWKRGHLQW
ncbi:hypothetical protein [Albibacterium indicum]|uniref:hypothetical protein n=1 Tax=Albibacterium indicum TaxID=2292082 RepID=UPI000E494D04|nr:hypothetical protein [Pedobacter indicus]